MQYVHQFQSILAKHKTEIISIDEVGVLKQIVDRYPAFQAARFLYVKGLHQNGMLALEDEMAVLAIHTKNREILFNEFSEVAKKQEWAKIEEKITASMPFSFGTVDGPEDAGTEDDLIKEVDRRIVTGEEQYYNIEKEFPTPNIEPEPEVKAKTQNPSASIIDAFLSQQSTKKTRYMRPSIDKDDLRPDMSLETPDDMVSETLAKIFIKQEKFKDAIKMYEKLSLLKPQKSVYFARQISELKKKIQ